MDRERTRSVVRGLWIVDRRTADHAPRTTNEGNFIRVCSGQVLVEFAIALPLLLFLTLGIMQLALLSAAKVVVNHAAFAAARAELVGESPQEAAEIACAPVGGTSGTPGDEGLPFYTIPGRGILERSGLAREKTVVDVVHPGASGEAFVRVDVRCDYELVFPIVSEIFKTAGAEHGGRPHRRLTETCTLARRWE